MQNKKGKKGIIVKIDYFILFYFINCNSKRHNSRCL